MGECVSECEGVFDSGELIWGSGPFQISPILFGKLSPLIPS